MQDARGIRSYWDEDHYESRGEKGGLHRFMSLNISEFPALVVMRLAAHPHFTVAVKERSTVRQRGLAKERATNSEGMELRRERVLLSEADTNTKSFLQIRTMTSSFSNRKRSRCW